MFGMGKTDAEKAKDHAMAAKDQAGNAVSAGAAAARQQYDETHPFNSQQTTAETKPGGIVGGALQQAKEYMTGTGGQSTSITGENTGRTEQHSGGLFSSVFGRSGNGSPQASTEASREHMSEAASAAKEAYSKTGEAVSTGAQAATDSARQAAARAQNAAGETIQAGKNVASQASRRVGETAEQLKEGTQERVHGAAESVRQTAGSAQQRVQSTTDSMRQGVDQRTDQMGQAYQRGQHVGADTTRSGVHGVIAGTGAVLESGKEMAKEVAAGLAGAIGFGGTGKKNDNTVVVKETVKREE